MKFLNISMDKFTSFLERSDTVLIPVGTLEAHGHHLPLGTDVLIPGRIAEALDARIGDRILIAPEINYGHSWYLSIYPGTIDISSETLINYLFEVGKGFLKWGFQNIVYLNGHGGNNPALTIVSEKLAALGARVAIINWWMDLRQEILEICEGQGHAGEDETSVIMAIDENLVDKAKTKAHWVQLVANVTTKEIARTTYPDALSGDARLATKEKGERIVDAVVDAMVGIIGKIRRDELIKEQP
ncbi:MAG: creatininase family protein [Syntrophothermus sp.]